MHHGTHVAYRQMVSSHSPEVAAWRSYPLIVIPACLTINVYKACFGRRVVSGRVAIEYDNNYLKRKKYNKNLMKFKVKLTKRALATELSVEESL